MVNMWNAINLIASVRLLVLFACLNGIESGLLGGSSISGCAVKKGFIVKKGVCVKASSGGIGGIGGSSVSVCGGKKGFFRASGKCVKVSTGRVNVGLGSAIGGYGRFGRGGGGFGRHLLSESASEVTALTLPSDSNLPVQNDTAIVEEVSGAEDMSVVQPDMNATDAEVITEEEFDKHDYVDIYPQVDTPAYEEAFSTSDCPDTFTDALYPELDAFVDGCSSDTAYPDFCIECTIPVMNAMRLTSPEFLSPTNVSFGNDADSEAVMRARCGADAIGYLESKGVVADEDFNDRMMGCMIYTDNPECPANAQLSDEESVDGSIITDVVDACKAKASAIMQNITNGTDVDSIINEAQKEYCSSCYWPFMKVLVNNGMSDDFWCDFKETELYNDELEQPQNLPSGSTETLGHISQGVYGDKGFVACLGNARAFFRREGPAMDPFSSVFNHVIRTNCWESGVVPSIDTFLEPATVTLMNGLACS